MEKIMDRRQFLIRTVAASSQLILPPFFDRALAFVENHGEPLLEAPVEPIKTLYAAYREEGVYWIIDGLMPKEIPPAITWREYFLLTGDDVVSGIENWELEPGQLDEPMGYWVWETYWCYNLSPNAIATRYLSDLDLGPEFGSCGEAKGEIRFWDAPMITSDCRWAEIDDLLSLSLLQNRLNELGENVSLEVGGEFN
ncbi:MAG TPA: hypothetical protein DG414_08955 [Gammaproteobacteria bacterium]|nr:hypothetical protein [Gammaproteobacteria bacterium]|tara:strand:- start:1448 stop:2038 length:591 start_codon:yes stop_codon:yes gene_type:complete